MTLLITVFAAIGFTVAWYLEGLDGRLLLGVPVFTFWGASIMWLVDAIAEYLAEGTEVFSFDINALASDVFLGLSVVALGLIIWLVVLFLKDPEGIVKRALKRGRR